MKISEIQQMIVEDSQVDMSNLAEESVRVISLHAKYLGLWQDEKTTLLIYDEMYKKKKKDKLEYYLGRSEDEIYEKSPLHLKIPRQDLDYYLDSDPELSELRIAVAKTQNKVDLLKAFIEHNLNQRSHHFRNAVHFLNWTQGK